MATWQLAGDVLVACNCDWGCPCNFNARPSRGKCEGGWVWIIDRGAIDGTAVDGLGIALFADWPGAIHEGGGRAVCFVDDRADDEQRARLAQVLRGEIGGPWGIFVTTYSLAAPQSARFDVHLDGYASRIAIGEVLELELQPMRNPVTGAETHPEVVLPEGLVVKRAMLAASKVFHVKDGVQYDHSGQYAVFARFDYAS